jgi:DNA repair protein RadA/Sms
MAKVQTKYICQDCGATSPRWMGKCEQCGNWNSFMEEIIDSSPHRSKNGKPIRVTEIADVKSLETERISTSIPELDQVLGGGVVPGSLILLGGDPGIGKSTIVLQAASHIRDSLYISGEESERQIQLRANRLNIKEGIKLASETNIENIIATLEKERPTLAVIDSIQTMYSSEISGAPGNISQISLCTSKLMSVCKENHIGVFIIGHVTKDGAIAGPRVLEHLVDVVLYIEGDRFGSFRILRGIKNRFGSTNETGIFEMSGDGMIPVKNPSEILISERAQQAPGSVIFPAMEGTRPLLTEIQALASATTFGYPKRTASGFDLNRMQLLAAVLTKRGGLNLSTQDIYLNVAGGISVREPAADLAVAIAIASAFKNKNIPEDLIVFGEVGLAGEVRSVNNIEKRLSEALKLGFKKAVIPKTFKSAPSIKGLDITTVKSLKEAIDKIVT